MRLPKPTSLMPAWQEEVGEAREVIKAKSPKTQLQGDEAFPVGQAPPTAPGQAAVEEQPEPLSERDLSPGRLFHQKYVACLQAGDLEGLLSQYHPDATLLSDDAGVAGTAGIARFFEQYFGGPGSLRAKPTGKYVEGRDSILCETSVETADSISRVHDVFVLRDGMATHQFTCTVEVTPKLTKSAYLR